MGHYDKDFKKFKKSVAVHVAVAGSGKEKTNNLESETRERQFKIFFIITRLTLMYSRRTAAPRVDRWQLSTHNLKVVVVLSHVIPTPTKEVVQHGAKRLCPQVNPRES